MLSMMGLTPRISIQRLPGNKYNFNQSEGLVIAWRPNLAPASKEHSMTIYQKWPLGLWTFLPLRARPWAKTAVSLEMRKMPFPCQRGIKTGEERVTDAESVKKGRHGTSVFPLCVWMLSANQAQFRQATKSSSVPADRLISMAAHINWCSKCLSAHPVSYAGHTI